MSSITSACSRCNCVLPSRRALKYHNAEVHGEVIECWQCSFTLPVGEQKKMAAHIARAHSSRKRPSTQPTADKRLKAGLEDEPASLSPLRPLTPPSDAWELEELSLSPYGKVPVSLSSMSPPEASPAPSPAASSASSSSSSEWPDSLVPVEPQSLPRCKWADPRSFFLGPTLSVMAPRRLHS